MEVMGFDAEEVAIAYSGFEFGSHIGNGGLW